MKISEKNENKFGIFKTKPKAQYLEQNFGDRSPRLNSKKNFAFGRPLHCVSMYILRF